MTCEGSTTCRSKERGAERLGEHLGSELETLDGVEITKTLETRDGLRYRIVRRTAARASVIVEDADGLDFELVSEGEGGLQTIEKGIVDTLVGWGKTAFDLAKN